MPITVRDFLAYSLEPLDLTVVHGGDYLDRVIPEEAINRPGLALADFYQYFANKRIQVLGLAELTYLKSLNHELRVERLERLFAQNIPCIVITRNSVILPELKALSLKFQVPIFQTPLITSRFINLATVTMEILTAPQTKMSGTMMDVQGVGVLIEGTPGIGKSEAALGLIERGHSLVSDDVTLMRRDSRGALVGTAPEQIRYHLEIRGLGIIHVPSLFGMAAVAKEAQLDMIVSLYHMDPAREGDRSGLTKNTRKLLDVSVPLVELPVAAGRDIAGVIEVAAMNQKLTNLGHDAAKEFDQKLIASLQTKLEGAGQVVRPSEAGKMHG